MFPIILKCIHISISYSQTHFSQISESKILEITNQTSRHISVSDTDTKVYVILTNFVISVTWEDTMTMLKATFELKTGKAYLCFYSTHNMHVMACKSCDIVVTRGKCIFNCLYNKLLTSEKQMKMKEGENTLFVIVLTNSASNNIVSLSKSKVQGDCSSNQSNRHACTMQRE